MLVPQFGNHVVDMVQTPSEASNYLEIRERKEMVAAAIGSCVLKATFWMCPLPQLS